MNILPGKKSGSQHELDVALVEDSGEESIRYQRLQLNSSLVLWSRTKASYPNLQKIHQQCPGNYSSMKPTYGFTLAASRKDFPDENLADGRWADNQSIPH